MKYEWWWLYVADKKNQLLISECCFRWSMSGGGSTWLTRRTNCSSLLRSKSAVSRQKKRSGYLFKSLLEPWCPVSFGNAKSTDARRVVLTHNVSTVLLPSVKFMIIWHLVLYPLLMYVSALFCNAAYLSLSFLRHAQGTPFLKQTLPF